MYGRKNHGSILVGDQIMIVRGMDPGGAPELEIWNLHAKYQHIYFYKTGNVVVVNAQSSGMGPLFPVNIDFCRN